MSSELTQEAKMANGDWFSPKYLCGQTLVIDIHPRTQKFANEVI